MATRKSKRRALSRLERLRQAGAVLARPWAIATAAAICLLPVVWGGFSRLSTELNQVESFRIDWASIEVSELPDWVPPTLREQVAAAAGIEGDLSILDDGLAVKIAEAYAAHPWVKSVNRVQVGPLTRVRIDVTFRRPCALVRTTAGLYPIDETGVVLPPADFAVTDEQRFPIIEHRHSLPQGPAGTHWGDLAVLAAARLADFLAPAGDLSLVWAPLQLTEIVIPQPAGDATGADQIPLEIRTRGGSVIEWGLAPGVDSPREPTATAKLERLQKYHSDYGSFEAPHGPYRFDIRRWQTLGREPLTPAAAIRESGRS